MRKPTSNPVLERGAASDLWRHTLSQIPSVFGRLVYLSSLRNPNTDSYEHHGFSQMFGDCCPPAGTDDLQARMPHRQPSLNEHANDIAGRKSRGVANQVPDAIEIAYHRTDRDHKDPGLKKS